MVAGNPAARPPHNHIHNPQRYIVMNKRTSMFMALGILTLSVGFALPALAEVPNPGPGSGIKDDRMDDRNPTSTRSSEATQPNRTPLPDTEYNRTHDVGDVYQNPNPQPNMGYDRVREMEYDRTRVMNYDRRRDMNYERNRDMNYNHTNPGMTGPIPENL